jgi:CO/xanthine dehydrogenase Mo-binding subunit
VLKRAAALIGWKARPAPGKGNVGRGIAYIHYKNNENYVAIAIEAQVNPATGAIRVQRVACAHDCGLMINPDAVRQQIEGNIYQTLSRTLFEESIRSCARDQCRLGCDLTFPDDRRS